MGAGLDGCADEHRTTATEELRQRHEIIEAASKFDTISVQRVHHDDDVVMQHLDSRPFSERLGIAPKQTVSTVLQIEADFVQRAGSVVFDAGTG